MLVKKIAVLMTMVFLAGCTSTPSDYASTLSAKDPKWRSAACRNARAEAAKYTEQNVNWAAGALIGPYGLALVAAGKEHQEKQRIVRARELHQKCSSQPLPRQLQRYPDAKKV